MLNSQTKKAIVALFIALFILGPVIEYLFVYMIAESRTIPAETPFFTAQFASHNPHNFHFFPAPCQKACFFACISHR